MLIFDDSGSINNPLCKELSEFEHLLGSLLVYHASKEKSKALYSKETKVFW